MVKKSGWILFYILCVVVLSGCLPLRAASQGLSYPEIFGKNWTQAKQFVKDNESWMRRECKLCGVDYPLAVSMVFPELVRYSALRDKIEITLLKALYTHKGPEYSDFSVGVFQIKPSCAEAILHEISNSRDRKLYRYFYKLHHSLSENSKRAAILKELEDPEAEFIYVLGMIRILDKKYEKAGWKSEDEKILFYATSYNGGFQNNENTIRRRMREDSFYTGLAKPAKCYSYGAVSLAFFHGL